MLRLGRLERMVHGTSDGMNSQLATLNDELTSFAEEVVGKFSGSISRMSAHLLEIVAELDESPQ